MVNKPITEVMEGGAKLANALNSAGTPVTFGKRSEGNTDLSTIINMAIDDIGTNRLTIEEKIPANTGYFKSYRFKWKNTYLSPDIDIPKDFLLKSVTLETCETDDYPVEGFVAGDKYIDFVVNVKEGTATDEHLYLNVNTFGSALSNAIKFKILPFISTNNMGTFGSGDEPYNYKYQNYINDVLKNHDGMIGTINLHTYYDFDGFEDGTIYLLSRIGTFEQYSDYTITEDEWGDCFYACIALYVPGMENTGLTTDGIVLESLMDTTLAFNYIPKSKIVDNLTTDDATKVLSAKQGKALQDGKQATLVSGTNISTINGQSLLNGGDLKVGASVGTFSDLQELISDANDGGTIILDKDYKFDSSTDGNIVTGIPISKNITLIGNGHIIDGNNTKRAFYISGQYTFNLSDVRIQNCNSSSNSGGAIDTTLNVTINITNTTFNYNNADTYGGAIFIGRDCNLTMTNCIFNQNNANTSGGAIYVSMGTITMKDSSFKNNTANNYANIYCTSTTTVYNCDINNISTTCYNVTNKNYLTDHQSIPSASTSTSGIVQLVDNLTTNDDTKALTAKQGKALYDMIAGIENDMLL